MQGVYLPTVKKLMGHSDIQTTMIYAHLAPDHLSNAVEKLPLGNIWSASSNLVDPVYYHSQQTLDVSASIPRVSQNLQADKQIFSACLPPEQLLEL